VSLLVEQEVIRRQGIELTKQAMRSTLLGAENARSSVSQMRQRGTFDDAKLGAAAAGQSDYRQTAMYDTVPVVAAWKSIAEVARAQGYQFRVPAVQPRNPVNQPTAEEAGILTYLSQANQGEYFAVESGRREIVLARTIRLTTDCMLCHGAPANSPRQDGRDLLGFPMEGWRPGQAHGAFVLRASLDRVDDVARAGMWQASLWLLPISLLMGGFVSWLTRRSCGTLKDALQGVLLGAGRVTLTSQQIAQASDSLAEGVNRQVARLQQSARSGQELRRCTERNTNSSENAVQLAAHSDAEVAESQRALEGMERAVDGIGASSQKIRKIIAVIDGLAFQTNILALNAAVEAARAGSAGLGFSVVADEVRSLAQRSAEAARDTSALIEDSIQHGANGQAQLRGVRGAFDSLTREFVQIRGAVAHVRDAGAAQMEEIERILEAVRALELLTQETSSHAEEGAAVAMSLDEEARLLQETVDRLHELAR
jgi:methyl-accepting chemotaxis protein